MALATGQDEGFQPEGFWSSVLGIFLKRGQAWKAFGALTVTFTSAAVGAISVTEQAVTGITNSLPQDVAIVSADGAPTANVGVLGTGRISAAGTLQLRYVNPTAGGLTPPASTVYRIALIQVS